MKKTLILVAGVAMLLGCERSQQAPEHQSNEAEQRWEGAKKKLAERYNAIADWESGLPEHEGTMTPFTIDLADALITTNGQPVLLEMELHDLVRRGDGVHAIFSSSLFLHGVFDLQADLQCPPEIVSKLRSARVGEFLAQAVIARIREVSRAGIELKGVSEGGEVSFESGYTPSAFFAKGECVDVLEREPVGKK